MKKRLLIVAGCMNTGGLEKQLMNLASNLDANKYAIDFTSDREESDYKEEILNNGWGYIYLPSTREVGLLQYCKMLYALLRKNRYDIVHSHELFHSGLVMAVARLAGVKKRIAHSHSTNDNSTRLGILKKTYHLMMRWTIDLMSTDRIACSREAGTYLFGKNTKRFQVIWNTVDTRRFITGKDLKKVVKPYKRIIHVGRFTELKNQEFILRIAEEAKRKGFSYKFTFVGDGETRTKNMEFAVKHDLLDVTEFLGARYDIPDLLHSSDVFILPSAFEGMPLSLLEAQAAGLPCVVSNTITDEVDFGLHMITKLSLSDPIEKWLDAIETAVHSQEVNAHIIRQAIKEKGFDNKDFAAKIDAVYSENS